MLHRPGITDAQLIEAARAVAGRRTLSSTTEVAAIGAALIAESGAVYTGVNIDTACSIGFCAEHAAIAAMVTAGESRITTIVAVSDRPERGVVPPCGRCREMIWQVHPENRTTRVLLAEDEAVMLGELLPRHWRAGRDTD